MSMERRGRGAIADSMDDDVSKRYQGQGAIFSRLSDDTTEGPLKCTFFHLFHFFFHSNYLAVEGYIVFVSNLHDETTEADLTDKFSKFGTILNLIMPLDRRSGYVKVYFEHHSLQLHVFNFSRVTPW